ncbi:MAG: DUF2157 domain-containing protein [Gemmatimonadetes bacterium]|nr:DUF2157 domain-containing protein [Gemmatimonadota bacterium]
MPSEPQQRVAAILAFREELARLEADGIARLEPTAKDRIRAHQDAVLATLAASGEVDLSARAARLSIGMRVATLLGTIALSAAYAFFVSAHWGQLGEAAQLALVILPPILLVGLTHLAALRERSGYVAALLATVAAIALAVNLGTLGTLYNLPDSRRVFLATGLFALLLAYGYRLTLPLLVAIGGLGGWLWSLGAIPLGLWWRDGFMRMEPLLLVGALAFAVPALTRGRRPSPPGGVAWAPPPSSSASCWSRATATSRCSPRWPRRRWSSPTRSSAPPCSSRSSPGASGTGRPWSPASPPPARCSTSSCGWWTGSGTGCPSGPSS